MTAPILKPKRYEARYGQPCEVFDTLMQQRSSTHDTFESATTRAYILNRFSEGCL